MELNKVKEANRMSSSSEIIKQANKLRTDLEQCQSRNELVRLRYELNQLQLSINIQSYPKYEQKQINQIIDELFKLIQIKFNQLSLSKFEFIGQPIPLHQKIPTIQEKPRDEEETSGASVIHTIKDEIYDIPSQEQQQHILLSSITNSIIRTNTSNPPGSIHLKQAKQSICLLESKGPIFIHDIRDSIIIIKYCHQARLHNINDSIIVIESVYNNRIIIEDCFNIWFNKVKQVEIDDFNFPTKDLQNPNYSYLMETKYNELMMAVNVNNVNEISTVIDTYLNK
ncbi:uncharacterized protein J8A68_000124 [[Candida] subhashii]|uniref:Tubulin binding cofactor C-like domain-containing protein n=1 Tax=[Candida] subhashii TaxID=561895 RepID=A0A8J5V5X7_9ASCO|nr:uncharacterized protein J8A68_000124 [[Candida] subhashii]KAG7666334.1 hypothetical protein J8A68_000124 [[Candida] subhashii]